MADEMLTNRIEAWLKGQLSAAEASAFAAEMAANPALAEEVELHQLTLRAMEHLSEQNLQQNVRSWVENVKIDGIVNDTSEPAQNKTTGLTFRKWIWVAVALLLLLLGVLFLYYKRKEKGLNRQIEGLAIQLNSKDSLLMANAALRDSLLRENEQLRQKLNISGGSPHLFTYYSKPLDLDNLTRTGNDESAAAQRLKEGLDYFYKNDMVRAERKARAALALKPENREAVRLLAHALFVQQRFLEAEKQFERMQRAYTPSSTKAIEAAWVRLLCYRALSADAGQSARYIAMLDEILKDSKHVYYKQAIQMKEAGPRLEK